MELESVTITVNVKATTEITYTIKTVEVEGNNGKKVKDLVNLALEIEQNFNDGYYEHVQVTSGNAVIPLNTELSDFKDDTVLDISK